MKSPLTRLALRMGCSLSLLTAVFPVFAQLNSVGPGAVQVQATGVTGFPTAPLSGQMTGLSSGSVQNSSGSAATPSNIGQQSGMPSTPDFGAADVIRNSPGAKFEVKPQGVNQFQRFVQETTGVLLPRFGMNLFDKSGVYAADSAAPAPDEYVLGPGDEVRIQIWGAIDFVGVQTLDRNGQISLPKIGTINLNGVQVKNLETNLRKQVGTVFTNVQLAASLGKLRGITVYVVGHAQQPGTYNLSSLSTLVNAIFASGGPSPNGSMRAIELKRAGQTVTTLDLYDFISKGDKTRDTALQPGDVIMIPPVGPRVALTGATDHGAIYEIKPGNTLQDVLALGGGLPTLVAPQKALLERVNPAQGRAPRMVQDLQLDAQGLGQALRDGDVLTLLPLSPVFSNAVTLRGNVAAPLRYSFQPGMRIADLIPEYSALIQSDYYQRKNKLVQFERGNQVTAERVVNEVKNLLEEINWDYAVVERVNTKEVKTELIPFNLRKAIRDKTPEDNIALQPGDIVTVFGVKDVPVPLERRSRFVRVSGEVQVPGIYQVKPGETLAQVVQRAGGLTTQAYAFGSIFTRESNRAQQQANLDQALRRLEADLSSQSATLVQNTTENEKSSTQLLINSQRSLIERMKQLKASGRVALEIEPEKQVFPDITLEDGDVLTIPNKPSFVSVFGSVMAETSFIWRKGETVGRYIDKAGLTRQADVDAALLIRADGTVLANGAQRSFLGLGNSAFMSTSLEPGDSVFVPELFDRRTAYTQFIQGAKDWTQLFYQFGLGAAAVKTLRN